MAESKTPRDLNRVEVVDETRIKVLREYAARRFDLAGRFFPIAADLTKLVLPVEGEDIISWTTRKCIELSFGFADDFLEEHLRRPLPEIYEA